MVERCAEGDKDVDSEANVNCCVKQEKFNSCQLWRWETELEWDEEAIVKRQNDDEKLPSCLSRVVLCDHELFIFRHHDSYNRLKECFNALDLFNKWIDFDGLLPFDCFEFVLDSFVVGQRVEEF